MIVTRKVELESLGSILCEVPWMKFRVIAEPDLSLFIKDVRIQALIQKITKRTVVDVRKQITEEFSETITRTMTQLVKEMTKTVDVHLSKVETSVVRQIEAVSHVKAIATATVCQPLGKDDYLCSCPPHHHEHHEHCPKYT